MIWEPNEITEKGCIADPHWFNADTDPAFQINADQYADPVPDPGFYERKKYYSRKFFYIFFYQQLQFTYLSLRLTTDLAVSNKVRVHKIRVSDPDLYWTRIQPGQWIRIRIWNPDPDPDPGRQK